MGLLGRQGGGNHHPCFLCRGGKGKGEDPSPLGNSRLRKGGVAQGSGQPQPSHVREGALAGHPARPRASAQWPGGVTLPPFLYAMQKCKNQTHRRPLLVTLARYALRHVLLRRDEDTKTRKDVLRFVKIPPCPWGYRR